MHLLKQGAKPSKPRKERKKYEAAAFIAPVEEEKKEEEEEKKEEEEQPAEEAEEEGEWEDEMPGVVHQDPAAQARYSKRNKSKAQPK